MATERGVRWRERLSFKNLELGKTLPVGRVPHLVASIAPSPASLLRSGDLDFAPGEWTVRSRAVRPRDDGSRAGGTGSEPDDGPACTREDRDAVEAAILLKLVNQVPNVDVDGRLLIM